MFLRRCERTKSGKNHVYWALVESYRTTDGSRQRVVAYLGELRKSERDGWAQLGRRLDRKDRPSPTLFDPPPHPEPDDDIAGSGNSDHLFSGNYCHFVGCDFR